MRNEPERKDVLSVRKPVRRTHLGNRVPKSSPRHPVFASNCIYKPGFPSPRQGSWLLMWEMPVCRQCLTRWEWRRWFGEEGGREVVSE